MWSEAGHAFLSQRCPHLKIELEALRPKLQTGFPWHHPENGHLELTAADLWWDAVHRRFADAFAELGWDDAHEACPYDTIRASILDPSRYRVFDDVEPVLRQLQERGWRQIIVSNHVPELPLLVERLGLSRWFDAIITSGVVGFEKPHPRLFDAARAVTPEEEVWMIGDNPQADFAGARRYGVNANLVRTPTDLVPGTSNLYGVLPLLQAI
jgi:putative hydrolase of the HAD superfamily